MVRGLLPCKQTLVLGSRDEVLEDRPKVTGVAILRLDIFKRNAAPQ